MGDTRKSFEKKPLVLFEGSHLVLATGCEC
jgi:hypothetical protein